MKIFIDTSSLFKLYHRENGTTELMKWFNENSVEAIYLSEITTIEFCSTVWKKCRKREIEADKASTLISKFEKDSLKYSFISDNQKLKAKAKDLIGIYWVNGLRTLDSIQLSSAIYVKDQLDLFISSDKLLSDIAANEHLKLFKWRNK